MCVDNMQVQNVGIDENNAANFNLHNSKYLFVLNCDWNLFYISLRFKL